MSREQIAAMPDAELKKMIAVREIVPLGVV
jgi:hypothetical protein